MTIATWQTKTSGVSGFFSSASYGSTDTLSFALGADGILTSTDTDTWTKRDGTANWFAGMAYSTPDGLYVAAGNAGVIYTSPDGITWTSRTSGTANWLNFVTYSSADDKFVTGGDLGTLLTSPDGITWTSRTSGTAEFLLGGAYSSGDDTFVVVGAAGVIITSSDGITWTSRTSGVATDLNWVVYAGSQFVAVGDGGVILTSPTGVTWTSRTSGVATDLYGIDYGDSTYVAVGAGGVIRTSSDGITWASSSSGTSSDLFGVGYNANRNKFVAVGASGVLLASVAVGDVSTPAGALTITGQPVMPGASSIPVGAGAASFSGSAPTMRYMYSETLTSSVTMTGTLAQNAILPTAPSDSVTNTLSMVDSVIMLKTAEDTMNLAETWSGVSIIVATVSSSVTLSETGTPAGILNASVADSVMFRFTLPDSSDQYEGWVVNATTFAPSRYDGFGFNSFAKIGNTYLGAKTDGVFELTGETDDGTNIDAAIMTGKLDFGSMQLKSMYNAVLGIAADGDMYLRVVHENAPAYTYKVNIRDEAMRNARVDIGRGMALRYWQVEVYNANGSDFDLESMKLYPVVLNRRITER